MVTLIGALAAIFTTSAMFPQAIKIIKSRDVKSISLLMYVANTLGIALWLLYGIFISNPVLIITNIVAIIPATTILILKLKLRNNEEQTGLVNTGN